MVRPRRVAERGSGAAGVASGAVGRVVSDITHQRLPRHTFNFLTGCGCVSASYFLWACSPAMRATACTMLATTIIFHGAHIVGHGAWADRYFMVFDVGVVGLGAYLLVYVTSGVARLKVLALIALALSIWIPSFGPWKGLPYNPTISAVHVLGLFANIVARQQACAA